MHTQEGATRHPDVLRYKRGYRAHVTIQGDSYTSKTYSTPEEAAEAAKRIRKSHTQEDV